MTTPLDAATNYVTTHCVRGADLAAAAGLSARDLYELDAAGVAPGPTYLVSPKGVRSAIGAVGDPDAGDQTAYFGPAVAPWLGRAALLARDGVRDLKAALIAWLADDLHAELSRRPAEARAFGYDALFDADGCDPARTLEEAATYWDDWMDGGWAVCLRRFDGRHLATKEIERRRIDSLVAAAPTALEPAARLALFDAVVRLDAVLLPFAPHERPTGTPGRLIDAPVRRYALPWPDRPPS